MREGGRGIFLFVNLRDSERETHREIERENSSSSNREILYPLESLSLSEGSSISLIYIFREKRIPRAYFLLMGL